jgi:hypothetical protein
MIRLLQLVMEFTMSGYNNAAARILEAQTRHCEQLAAAVAEARATGLSRAEIEDLEAQELAARRRYQELAVDMPGQGRGMRLGGSTGERRPWWRFW